MSDADAEIIAIADDLQAMGLLRRQLRAATTGAVMAGSHHSLGVLGASMLRGEQGATASSRRIAALRFVGTRLSFQTAWFVVEG